MAPTKAQKAIIECVPNFSEGRDRAVIDALAEVAGQTAGVALLDRTSDADHNRTVLTIAGEAAGIIEAAVRLGGVAATRIDLRKHTGAHPRLGAMDVCPLVPVSGGITMAQCAELAQWIGNRLWLEHRIPVFFYEEAALSEDRRKLEDVRRAASRGEWRPDVGGPEPHVSAGATVVGARKFLIAFNINLAANDVTLAREIARAIRASNGGLPAVKALGLELASEGIAQVSMNLVDYEVTGIETVFKAVEAAARERGAAIKESELIGLAPAAALNEAIAERVKLRGWSPAMILENRLASELFPGGAG